MLDGIATVVDGDVVLHDLTLEIPAGEITVLMGPSGVGKSTLVKHIVGLLRPDDGTVLIGGQDVWRFSRDEWRSVRAGMGTMLGGSYLVSASTFGSLSVLENLSFTLEALGVPKEERHERVLARLHELQLMEYHDRRPEQLPAHATKRLALAKALIPDAPLTVIDEIDVGLDQQHSRATLEAIRAHRERVRSTLLITTHNLELARSIADRIAIMVGGRIVAYGPPDDVLRGITTTEDFDLAFEFSGKGGAAKPDPSMIPGAERPTPESSPRNPAEMQWIYIALIAVMVIVGVFAAVKLHLF
jgi:phospholipid/cholesterol/gamma-HCH transport system ATP-binding protein